MLPTVDNATTSFRDDILLAGCQTIGIFHLVHLYYRSNLLVKRERSIAIRALYLPLWSVGLSTDLTMIARRTSSKSHQSVITKTNTHNIHYTFSHIRTKEKRF